MYPSALQEFLCDDEYKYSTHDKCIVTLFNWLKRLDQCFSLLRSYYMSKIYYSICTLIASNHFLLYILESIYTYKLWRFFFCLYKFGL